MTTSDYIGCTPRKEEFNHLLLCFFLFVCVRNSLAKHSHNKTWLNSVGLSDISMICEYAAFLRNSKCVSMSRMLFQPNIHLVNLIRTSELRMQFDSDFDSGNTTGCNRNECSPTASYLMAAAKTVSKPHTKCETPTKNEQGTAIKYQFINLIA